MSILDPTPSPWAGRILGIFRIVAGFSFITFGTMKLFGFPPGPHMPVPLFSLFGLGGVLETFGGLLILLGLFTKPVAFVLSGEMAVAYFMVHLPMSFWPSVNMGAPAILFCFFFLYLVFAGPGDWSLDVWLARSRGAAPAGGRALGS
jgi:putative oxidoreductase